MRWSHHCTLRSFIFMLFYLIATSSALSTTYSSDEYNTQLLKRETGERGGHTVIVFPDRAKTAQSRPQGPERRVEMNIHRQNSSPKSSPPPGWQKSEGGGHTKPGTQLYKGPPQFTRQTPAPSRTQWAVGAVKKLFGGGRH